MENKTPAAEEFAWDKIDFQTALAEMNYQEVYYLMQEFAKLHVEAALKAASGKLPYDDRLNQDMMLKKSILNSYPLTNIK